MTWNTGFDPTAGFAGGCEFPARNIVVAQSAALVRFAVLGRVTATDKYIVSVATATDGSQNPRCILSFDTDASAADAPTDAYFEGEFAGEKLVFDSSWTIATLEAAFRQQGLPIYIRSIGVLV